MDYTEFASKIRKKYPGSYDDLDDNTLAKKVVAKYPNEYSDVTFSPQAAPEAASPNSLIPKIIPEAASLARQGAIKLSGLPRDAMRGFATTALNVASGVRPDIALAEAAMTSFPPGSKPKTPQEKVASLAADLADPRAIALNAPSEELISGALKVGGKAAGWVGRQAAKGLSAISSVPEQDILMAAKNPVEILFSKSAKKAGKIFQQAKESAGVSGKEERLIAGIGDPSGWKRVADKLSAKFERTGDLSIGEALAWKKSASELAQAPRYKVKSGGALYTQDALKAQSLLEEKAKTNPTVARILQTQADTSKSIARRAFLHVFPYNQSGKAAVARTITAGGVSTINPALAALFSPLTAGAATFSTGLASKGISKGLNFAAKSRAARQALLAALANTSE